jgi:hypothetical protein
VFLAPIYIENRPRRALTRGKRISSNYDSLLAFNLSLVFDSRLRNLALKKTVF